MLRGLSKYPLAGRLKITARVMLLRWEHAGRAPNSDHGIVMVQALRFFQSAAGSLGPSRPAAAETPGGALPSLAPLGTGAASHRGTQTVLSSHPLQHGASSVPVGLSWLTECRLCGGHAQDPRTGNRIG